MDTIAVIAQAKEEFDLFNNVGLQGLEKISIIREGMRRHKGEGED